MRLTTKARTALSAMMDPGLRQHRGPVALAGIGLRQKISVSYLEQLFAKLRRHELVESTRGARGGYRLAKPVASISVADIVSAVDESLDPESTAQKRSSPDDALSATQELWSKLDRNMVGFLRSVSLGDLIEQRGAQASQTPASTRAGYLVLGAPSNAR